MNTRLNHITNWPELAGKAKWSAAAMAKLCGVSVRTLHRHFLKNMGKNTKTWLAEQRQRKAHELLGDGRSVKEAAGFLGYKWQKSLSRGYKRHWGICPSIGAQPPFPEI
jgi:transcriptional regulator GlxA family with amidase domain